MELQVNISAKGAGFPAHKIRAQLARIFESENFRTSETLKTFLAFIVEEKLAGRENQLKEYTIAVNVLHKSPAFKPQENCIVRIHAVRMRKALAAYYETKGLMDEIRINLPKGSYIPQFSQNIDRMLKSALKDTGADGYSPRKPFHVAVIPFHTMERIQLATSFSDGLAVQLSTALSGIKDLSPISYNMIRRIPEKFQNVKDIASIFDTDFVITGDVQFQKNQVRVNIEVLRTDNFEQVWSLMLERRITAATLFSVEDEIVEQVLNGLKKENILFRRNGVVVMAVA